VNEIEEMFDAIMKDCRCIIFPPCILRVSTLKMYALLFLVMIGKTTEISYQKQTLRRLMKSSACLVCPFPSPPSPSPHPIPTYFVFLPCLVVYFGPTDKDSSGGISLEELSASMNVNVEDYLENSHGLTVDDVKRIFEDADIGTSL
jgi:hypothetical protein